MNDSSESAPSLRADGGGGGFAVIRVAMVDEAEAIARTCMAAWVRRSLGLSVVFDCSVARRALDGRSVGDRPVLVRLAMGVSGRV